MPNSTTTTTEPVKAPVKPAAETPAETEEIYCPEVDDLTESRPGDTILLQGDTKSFTVTVSKIEDVVPEETPDESEAESMGPPGVSKPVREMMGKGMKGGMA